MATEVTALVARLEADTRKFDKGMKSAQKRLKGFDKQGATTRKNLGKTDSAMGNLTNSVKGFAAAAGVAFATRAVVNFAKSAINAASDLGESINAVEVVFGDAAEGIKSLGVEAAEAVGLSNAEFNSLAVGFAAFVEKIDAGGDDVVGVMKELTGRAADFASVMNIDVAEAATIFRSGLAGETEPLRKFGIDLSAATVNLKALELGLADTSSELTEQDKIIARYNLLMEQTDKTAGDFANTSDDLANSQRILSAKLTDVKAVIGEKLIPVVTDVVGLMSDWLDIIDALASSTDDMGEAGERSIVGRFFDVFGWKILIDVFKDFTRRVGNLTGANDALAEASALVLGPLDLTLEAYKTGAMRAEEYEERVNAVKDATDGLEPPDDDIAKEFKKIKTEAEKAAERIDKVQTALRKIIDPAFAVIEAAFDYTDALAKQDEVLNDVESSERDRIEAGIDSVRAFGDLMAAADAYAAVLDTDVATALRFMADQGVISFDTLALLLEKMDEFDGFQGQAQLELDYIEKNRAALERFLRVNIGAGAPGANLPPPAPPSPADIRFFGHSGGVVPGLPGTNVPAVLQAGETVRTVRQERALQGGGGVVINVNGFVGSELQLAAQIDKLLTRRSKTSKLGF